MILALYGDKKFNLLLRVLRELLDELSLLLLDEDDERFRLRLEY